MTQPVKPLGAERGYPAERPAGADSLPRGSREQELHQPRAPRGHTRGGSHAAGQPGQHPPALRRQAW